MKETRKGTLIPDSTNLNDIYDEIKILKYKFATLIEIDPKNSDSVYKYLLHSARKIRNDLLETVDILVRVLRTLEEMKSNVESVNLE